MAEINPFTRIREAIEALFVGRLEPLVGRVLRFNGEAAINFDDPALQITRWLRVEPLGGPVDPYDTHMLWKFTRRFRVLFNLPAGNMDVGQLEEIEHAMTGLIAEGVNGNLQLDFVSAVRWEGGNYGVFFREGGKKKPDEGEEMWVAMGVLEVDFRELRSTIAGWAPVQPD